MKRSHLETSVTGSRPGRAVSRPPAARAELEELRRTCRALAAERDALRESLERSEEQNQALQTEAVELARTREGLFSSLAHELRTPLQTMALNVDLSLRRLARPDVDVSTDWMAERLTRLRTGVQRLSRLCDTFLSTTAIERGELQPCLESVDLRELALEVVGRMAEDLGWAGCPVTVVADEPHRGHWDRVHLDLILSSLLENAMKYGAGRPVTVSLRRAVPVAGEGGCPQVELEVSDSGVGIPREDSLRVFEPYTRLESQARLSGFGLGLWLVRELSAALGGRVWVAEGDGQGAVFTVRLPVQPH